MRGRPAKAARIIKLENVAHRTKAELKAREMAENKLVSGVKYREKKSVKNNAEAHREFLRLQKIYASIEQNDALLENVVNRYCMLYSECCKLEEQLVQTETKIDELTAIYTKKAQEGEGVWEDLAMIDKLNSQNAATDKRLQSKRDMMFKIERENLMTVSSVLRSIPKKAPVQDKQYDFWLNYETGDHRSPLQG